MRIRYNDQVFFIAKVRIDHYSEVAAECITTYVEGCGYNHTTICIPFDSHEQASGFLDRLLEDGYYDISHFCDIEIHSSYCIEGAR